MGGIDENFFRHEYGRLVSVLTCRFGVMQVERVEDAVQSALLLALERWPCNGTPKNRSAWLFRVASNNLASEIRNENRRRQILADNCRQLTGDVLEHIEQPEEMRGDMVQIVYACCHDSIPIESSLVFALKTLCGFDVDEIAVRLFTSTANVYKRLGRARCRLKELKPSLTDISLEEKIEGEPTVLRVLYLMFTEGHMSLASDLAVRKDLCDEAIRLAFVVAEDSGRPSSQLCALIALMLLHAARNDSRLDEFGGLLLLEEQDRSRWDRNQICKGLGWRGQQLAIHSLASTPKLESPPNIV